MCLLEPPCPPRVQECSRTVGVPVGLGLEVHRGFASYQLGLDDTAEFDT